MKSMLTINLSQKRIIFKKLAPLRFHQTARDISVENYMESRCTIFAQDSKLGRVTPTCLRDQYFTSPSAIRNTGEPQGCVLHVSRIIYDVS